MLLALPHPHMCSLILRQPCTSPLFEFLHVGVWGIERGGWGSQCVVYEHEHAEMEGCELNMYVLSALLCHCGGILPVCGVYIFANVCMSVCVSLFVRV